MMGFSEKEIVDTIKNGDLIQAHNALKSLYINLWPSANQFMSNYNIQQSDKEDIYQEVMALVYQKLRDPKFELTSAAKTYVFGIIKNKIYNIKRKSKKVSLELDDQWKDSRNLEQDFISNERNQSLMQALRKLGGKCSDVLKLFYFERMSMKDIAALMNYSSDQVAKNKKRACLNRLKDYYKINKLAK